MLITVQSFAAIGPRSSEILCLIKKTSRLKQKAFGTNVPGGLINKIEEVISLVFTAKIYGTNPARRDRVAAMIANTASHHYIAAYSTNQSSNERRGRRSAIDARIESEFDELTPRLQYTACLSGSRQATRRRVSNGATTNERLNNVEAWSVMHRTTSTAIHKSPSSVGSQRRGEEDGRPPTLVSALVGVCDWPSGTW